MARRSPPFLQQILVAQLVRLVRQVRVRRLRQVLVIRGHLLRLHVGALAEDVVRIEVIVTQIVESNGLRAHVNYVDRSYFFIFFKHYLL